jgi:hypothetical protein
MYEENRFNHIKEDLKNHLDNFIIEIQSEFKQFNCLYPNTLRYEIKTFIEDISQISYEGIVIEYKNYLFSIIEENSEYFIVNNTKLIL